jgi:2-amino-4-hydroxy-6-hydroxymethyldihydropteridine diphosphokinase / dihydropteroate synthase
MKVVIGLGSNLERPLQQLRRACRHLQQEFSDIISYSDIYSSQALVPEHAPQSWSDKIYLNAAISVETDLSPEEVLKRLKKIERNMGRSSLERWAPRVIDLDILVFGAVTLNSPELKLPHAELHKRNFVLLPLWDVWPEYRHPHFQNLQRDDFAKTAGIKKLPHLLAGPQIMGILNITPDSFADGGKYLAPEVALHQAQKLFEEGADIIDIGAESTRPDATLLDIETEWRRLEPILTLLHKLWSKTDHRPLISIDTRHAEIIRRALTLKMVDWINDVSQEEFDAMRPLLKDQALTYVAMHHLGVPPVREKILTEDPISALRAFAQTWEQRFLDNGLMPSSLILDPGLGFGKSVMQQLAIINNFYEFTKGKGTWLVGHSRKSFFKSLLPAPHEEAKEAATALISARLAKQKVAYLRVHAPMSSLAAIRLDSLLSLT